MKRRDIQRAIRTRRYERSAGDAPSMGRVARVPGTGLPKGERRKKRRGERGGDRLRNNRYKVMLTWWVVLVVFAIGILIGAVWFWLLPNMRRSAAAGGGAAAKAPAEERVVSRFASPSEEAALNLVKRAVKVRDPGMVAEFFHPGTTPPGEVVRFLAGMQALDGAISGFVWLSSMDANGLLIDGVAINSIRDDVNRQRLVFLTPDETGKWKIDFDSFARTVKPSWSDLLEKNAGLALVRVYAANDSYYNGPFRDETQWVCFGMASPDTHLILLGYCRKGSSQEAAMERVVSGRDARNGGGASKRVTLEIRRQEGAEPRQFEITRVLAEDWVMSAVPFDETSK